MFASGNEPGTVSQNCFVQIGLALYKRHSRPHWTCQSHHYRTGSCFIKLTNRWLLSCDWVIYAGAGVNAVPGARNGGDAVGQNLPEHQIAPSVMVLALRPEDGLQGSVVVKQPLAVPLLAVNDEPARSD